MITRIDTECLSIHGLQDYVSKNQNIVFLAFLYKSEKPFSFSIIFLKHALSGRQNVCLFFKLRSKFFRPNKIFLNYEGILLFSQICVVDSYFRFFEPAYADYGTSKC